MNDQQPFYTESEIFKPRHVFGWVVFTLSAGFVNASAVLASKNVVSHITGNVTNMATDTALAGSYLLVVTLFIVGAMVAVLVTETLRERPKLAFAIPIVMSTVLLVAISIAGRRGHFGVFGDDDPSASEFTMLGLLAGSMGLVNAAISAATNNQIRVTHLSGPATDFAGHVVRAALDRGKGRAVEFRWATLRFVKLTSFAVGVAIAAVFAGRLQFDLFAVAAVILAVALALNFAPSRTRKASVEHAESEAARTVRGERSGTLEPASARSRAALRAPSREHEHAAE